ncbi:unnamed protein product [Moneuplotes crassus]|uniref:Uncharacterized protein n=1 Tax=Euplotes crassus TaxID=5936 RepID=A0AAD2D9Q4_EUPCR|nr:unnamed protein product [Moneuplotes crassus]
MKNIEERLNSSFDNRIHNRSFSLSQISSEHNQMKSYSIKYPDDAYNEKKYMQISTERLRSINKERKQLQLLKKQEKMRTKRLIEKEAQKKLQLELLKKKEREQKNEFILKKIEQRKIDRERSLHEREEEYKKVKNITPMFEKLRKSYVESHELPELQKKKEILTSIRDLHQPINFKEFCQHEKKWKKNRKSMMKKLVDKRKEMNRSSNNLPYKSKFTKDYLEQEAIRISEKLHEKEKRSNYRVKLKHYGKLVQHTFRPEISKTKKQEIEAMKEMYPNERCIIKSNERKSTPSNASVTPQKKHPYRQTGFPRSTNITMPTKKKAWKKVNPMVPKEKPKEESKTSVTVDYLQDFKKKRSKKGKKPDLYYAQQQIKRHLKKNGSMSPKEQMDEVKNLSRALNEKAEQKLQQVMVNKKSSNLIEESNNLIIDSINSKLMLLQKI